MDEVVLAVGIALGSADLQRCPKLDQNGDGLVTIDEILLAVNATVNGCPLSPTPIPATFARIQETIFTPTCLDLGCHNARDRLGDLVLEAGVAYDALVGVAPANFAAAATGFLRVDPERPETSFLLTKVTLPRPEHGSLMPLGKPPLTADQVQLIRDWILQGALR